MSAAYPGSIASFPTYANLDLITPTVANQPDGEIVAVETGLLNGFAHDLKSDATGNNRSLGVSGNAFYNLLLSNNATIGGDATIGGNATIGGTFAVTGAADMSGGAKIVSGQTALDLFYAASGTTVGRIAVGTGLQSLRVNAGATGYEFYTPVSNVPFSAFFGTVFENLTRLNARYAVRYGIERGRRRVRVLGVSRVVARFHGTEPKRVWKFQPGHQGERRDHLLWKCPRRRTDYWRRE